VTCLAAVRAETLAAWTMPAHGTETLETFLPDLLQKRCYWERVARETFPDAPRTAHVQAWVYSHAFFGVFPPRSS